MNIYFSCSITGGRQDQAAYQSIVAALQSDGHTVPTAILADQDILRLETVTSAEDIYQRDIAWLDHCDAVVAEISTPSHGVGYEIAYALEKGKPVYCGYLYDRKVTKMILGNDHPNLKAVGYHEVDEMIREMRSFLAGLSLKVY
jgi:2'-deoxynucleoside 5'-phosphate N-hydrolase